MSLQARRELLNNLRTRYRGAGKKEKKRILDEFTKVTQYGRKHAIYLLNQDESQTRSPRGVGRQRKYDDRVKQALLRLWHIANEICSKRLIPFLPDLLEVLERTGQIDLEPDVRAKLLTMCPATADQLLASERKTVHGKSTTRSGALLKRQIPVRTFSDWNDVVPGFFEADLVAHCGSDTSGTFLNTLVLTDIATSWTECFALLRRSEEGVIQALRTAQRILPVPLLGFDSDNGSEFINHGLIDFCREQKITFTRSRAWKKNDQAHVEERNGSVVRRTVGYDRYEGTSARDALERLYETMRLYVNFFQPTMKLVSKEREGSKVHRKYDAAQTPFRRMLNSPVASEKTKRSLRRIYAQLDPVALMTELEQLQDGLWQHAWRRPNNPDSTKSLDAAMPAVGETPTALQEFVPSLDSAQIPASPVGHRAALSRRQYRRMRKPRKPLAARTWSTRADPLEGANAEIEICFQQNPNITAQQLLTRLQKKYPGKYPDATRRTLMRRLKKLRSSGDGPAILAPVRQTYPRHIKSRAKLSTEQWKLVTSEVNSCFEADQNISAQRLLPVLRKKFPGIVSDAQLKTIQRRLKKLREAGQIPAI